MKKVLLSLFCLIVFIQLMHAQRRPPFKVLRFEENHNYLLDSTFQKTKLDKLKNISIGDKSKVSFGGEIAQTFEYVARPFSEQIEDAYWTSRIMVHSNLEINKNLRFFGELANGSIDGRNGGARPIDRDDLYVLNLFTEFNKGKFKGRLGRQELKVGHENLLSIRNGTTLRYTFDAARFWWKEKNWTLESFAGTAVTNNPKAFDNPVFDTDENIIWGIYGTFFLPKKLPQIETYYIGLKDQLTFYNQYIGAETRHTLGIHLRQLKGKFNYTFAGVYQFGEAGEFSVNAFQLAAIFEYQFKKSPLKISWNTYLSSGDKDANDNVINSFNPLYPQQGNFMGALATRTFPMNILFSSPRISMQLFPIILTLDAGFLWRHRKTEGIFIPGGFPSYLPEDENGKFLGNQFGISAFYIVNRHLSLLMLYSHFEATDYFKNQPSAGQVNDFFIGKVIYKF